MAGSINQYSTARSGSYISSKLTSTIEQISDTPVNRGASGIQNSVKLTISTTASQLAASASRADERDKTLTRSEMADKAKSVLNQIVGDSYYANKTLHDGEVPKTTDPELLSRAKQATRFVNDAAKGGQSVKNPFSGLSREQLSNIFTDESGSYTVNERQAAWRESCEQEEVWRRKVIAEAIAEFNSTGKLTNFFGSVLDHFKELPAMEQALYPEDYASDLQSKIRRDFNYRTHQSEGKGEEFNGIVKMQFAKGPQLT